MQDISIRRQHSVTMSNPQLDLELLATSRGNRGDKIERVVGDETGDFFADSSILTANRTMNLKARY